MTVKQLSVFLENRPGRMAEITALLADHGIDIRAVTISDTTEFGILRIIVSAPEEAEALLKDAGYTVMLSDVIAVDMEDTPGSLAVIMDCLWKAGISVEYLYAFLSKSYKKASVILRVDKPEEALIVLQTQGLSILSGTDIYNM